MKKISSILFLIFIMLLSYLSKSSDMLLLTMSFSLAILFLSIFSTASIRKKIEEYQNNKLYYSRDRLFIFALIEIALIGLVLGITSYFIGTFINVKYLSIINIIMTFSVTFFLLLKVISEYLVVLGYKKIGTKIIDVYIVIVLIINIITSIFSFGIFKINTSTSIFIIYIVNILIFVLVVLFLHFTIFRKIKKHLCKREEIKLNYRKDFKNLLIDNNGLNVYNIIRSSYLYISIIILYYCLINKYNYSYASVSEIITNTYFYGIIFIYYIYNIIKNYIKKEIIIVKEKIKNNDFEVSKETNNLINKLLRISLSVTIILCVISNPLSRVLLNSNYNPLFGLSILLFTYLLFDLIIVINSICIKKKKVLIILILGLLAKIAFEIPLVSAAYRMGLSLSFGSILSIILGMMVSLVIGVILIEKKLKLPFLDNFINILNIIYENIILCLILVLFTFIIKVETNGIISSILVIIFYLFITILYYIVKRLITRKLAKKPVQ